MQAASTSVGTLSTTSFNIGAVLICLTCLVYLALHRRFEKLQSKIFIAIIIDLAITAISDTTAELVRTYAMGSAFAPIVVEVSGYIYFLSHTLLAPLFCMYVMNVCGGLAFKGRLRNKLIGIPCIVMELLVLTNPITHWVYHYGPNLECVRGWAVYVAFLVGIIYSVLGFVQLISHWGGLTRVKRRALVYFFTMASVGVILQLFAPSLRAELFAEALAVLGIMLFVENEEDLIDPDSGVYNRHAMELDLELYEKNQSTYYIVATRITNIDSYAHLGGSVIATKFINEEIVGYLKTILPWYHIYRTTPTRFVLIEPRKSFDEMRAIAEAIADRFKRSWSYHDVEVDFQAIVALASVPDELPSASDVFYFVDTPMPMQAGKSVLMGEDLNYLRRRAEVELAVKRGLDEGGYEVYYQPILDADGKPCSAEALMRLHDKEIGDVSPFEFIEVAERMGVIEAIGEFALREVCAFLASGIPQKLGIKRLSVNLSVVQCMQVDFAANVDAIITSYNIDPNQVSFEITESVAAGDYQFLARMMDYLRTSGHRFAMDDYGTGYSNMHSLVALDFDVIKIDKSVLWDAEKSGIGLTILRNGVNMARDIDCEILVEGVETAEQVEMLHSLGIDFYQGFYFAKPMTKDEFIAFLEHFGD